MVAKPESSLEQTLFEGQLVNRKWLLQRGFSRPRVDYFLRSGKLESIAHGVYRRPGPPLKWEHVVYSLTEMGYPVYVGGRSALELQGLAHYLPSGGVRRIDLYGSTRVPRWVLNYPAKYRIVAHTRRLFELLPRETVKPKPFGSWDWPIAYAAPELAMLELLSEVGDAADFAVADKFFEAATNFRPEILQALLRTCSQVKAKRLFLWLSNRHKHDWLQTLKTDGINLGKGKRMLVKGGVFDSTYQITVPREMAIGSDQSIY
jgi:hypothetical protein